MLYWLLLCVEVPMAQVVFQSFLAVFQFELVVPFIDLILIFGMQALANNPNLPVLFRFNLRQAILLDVGLGLFGLLNDVTTNTVQLSLPFSPIFLLSTALTS